MNDMKKYKISEVAKLFDITRTALIHYDNYGLLSPSIRNEKNYRYYTSDDLQKLELILALKESGLTLKEIQSYLTEEGKKTSIELLNHQKKEIDKKIETLKMQRYIIEKRLENLTELHSIDIYEGIKLNEYPEMIIIKEPIGYGPLMTYDSAVSRLRRKLEQEGSLSSKFGICFDTTHSDQLGKYKMKYIFDYLNAEGSALKSTKQPSSKFIRCLHKGKHTTVEITINKLLSYANEKNYIVSGEAYFIPLFNYWESISDEFVGEVLIPIKIKND
ncbi:MAG: MerR family transcriptional regulator [Tissierellales bacterium]|jgi:DNA-binding transcriptional MerR regulator|nr:MerR family transcriptional regulator [Tissierellales bacterium]